jgi:hypothetical protein
VFPLLTINAHTEHKDQKGAKQTSAIRLRSAGRLRTSPAALGDDLLVLTEVPSSANLPTHGTNPGEIRRIFPPPNFPFPKIPKPGLLRRGLFFFQPFSIVRRHPSSMP